MRTPTEARALERDDILEMMCQEHHKIRTAQGFTTAKWYDLEQRNRDQYRDAMSAALIRLETDLRERFIRYVDSGPEPTVARIPEGATPRLQRVTITSGGPSTTVTAELAEAMAQSAHAVIHRRMPERIKPWDECSVDEQQVMIEAMFDAGIVAKRHLDKTAADGYFTKSEIQEGDAFVLAAGFGVCADPDFAEVGQPVVTIERMPKTWRDMHALIDLIVGLGAHVAHSAEAKKQIEEGRQNRA